MDKQLLIIIIFLGVTFSLAGILVMGAVPKIFQTAEETNQTQEIANQTLLHEREDDARKAQSAEILNETKRGLIKHHHELEKFMEVLYKDNHKLLENQDHMIANIQKILDKAIVNMAEHQLTIKKYGTENNAIGRAIAKELGLNVTTILDEYYTKHNMTPIYPPPPKINATTD